MGWKKGVAIGEAAGSAVVVVGTLAGTGAAEMGMFENMLMGSDCGAGPDTPVDTARAGTGAAMLSAGMVFGVGGGKKGPKSGLARGAGAAAYAPGVLAGPNNVLDKAIGASDGAAEGVASEASGMGGRKMGPNSGKGKAMGAGAGAARGG